ncbi:LacI family transcriptional regulator [Sesbania bispinosa]|nr:LacI family transcriptional regulator [Sesbania bispinosa]
MSRRHVLLPWPIRPSRSEPPPRLPLTPPPCHRIFIAADSRNDSARVLLACRCTTVPITVSFVFFVASPLLETLTVTHRRGTTTEIHRCDDDGGAKDATSHISSMSCSSKHAPQIWPRCHGHPQQHSRWCPQIVVLKVGVCPRPPP